MVSYDLAWAATLRPDQQSNNSLAHGGTEQGRSTRTLLEPTVVGSNRTGSPGFVKALHPATFILPEYLGCIKDSWKGNVDKIVIHIQDAHCNYATQHKISEIIEYLNKEYRVNTINLEGGAKDYDLTMFTDIADKTIRDKVADYFVKEGLVNGAEYFAINNPEKVSLWGIEEPDLYIRNLKIYRDSLKNKDDIDGHINSLGYILNSLKRHIYSKELLELDLKTSQYKAGNLGIKDYVNFLVRKAKEKSIDLKSLANANMLLRSLDAEAAIDFKKADLERERVIVRLQRVLSKNELKEFVEKTVEFKAGQLLQENFYKYFIKKAGDAGVFLGDFPELQKYISYVFAYGAIDRIKVMGEIESLEARLGETLYQNDDQMELGLLSKNLALIDSIFDISLTKYNYENYRKNKDSFRIQNYIAFINKKATLYKMTAQLDKGITELDRYIEGMVRFYEYSLKRDEAFVRNVKFSETKNRRTEIAVIVTGGFHAENLKELFKKDNVSYISIMPNFKVENVYQSPYYRLLSGKIYGEYQRTVQLLELSTLALASIFNQLGEMARSREELVMEKARIHMEIARATAGCRGVEVRFPDGSSRRFDTQWKKLQSEDVDEDDKFEVVSFAEMLLAAPEPDGSSNSMPRASVNVSNLIFVRKCVNKMRQGIPFDAYELAKLGFSSNEVLFDWTVKVAVPIMQRDLENFRVTRQCPGLGIFSRVTVDDSKDYVRKELIANEDLNRRSINGYSLAAQRMGGLDTPYLLLGLSTILLSRVIPIDDAVIAGRGKSFIDDYMNSLLRTWRRGIFDHDMKFSNFGYLYSGSLVGIDRDFAHDASDEATYAKNANPAKDWFNSAIDWLHVNRDQLRIIDSDLAAYFEKQVKERLSIELLAVWPGSSYRSNSGINPMADRLRAIVKAYAPPITIKRYVYPLVSQRVEDEIVNRLLWSSYGTFDKRSLSRQSDGMPFASYEEHFEGISLRDVLGVAAAGVPDQLLDRPNSMGSIFDYLISKKGPNEQVVWVDMPAGQCQALKDAGQVWRWHGRLRRIGIDLSNKAGVERGRDGIELLEADMLQADLGIICAPEKPDLVTIMHGASYSSDPLALVANSYNQLSNGGFLVVGFPFYKMGKDVQDSAIDSLRNIFKHNNNGKLVLCGEDSDFFTLKDRLPRIAIAENDIQAFIIRKVPGTRMRVNATLDRVMPKVASYNFGPAGTPLFELVEVAEAARSAVESPGRVYEPGTIGVYGIGSLGAAFFKMITPEYFIGIKDSLSTREVMNGSPVVINDHPYPQINSSIKNGLADCWEKTGHLPELLLIASRKDGAYSAIEEFIGLLEALEKEGIVLKEEEMPTFVVCSNSLLFAELDEHLLRMIECSVLKNKGHYHRLLRQVIILGATFQTATRSNEESEAYVFNAENSGRVVLEGGSPYFRNKALTKLREHGYAVETSNSYRWNIKKNITTILYGILGITLMTSVAYPADMSLRAGHIVDPVGYEVGKFSNPQAVAEKVRNDQLRIAQAYIEIMSNLGYNVEDNDPAHLIKTIEDEIMDGGLNISDHVPATVRFFEYAFKSGHGLGDELGAVRYLIHMADEMGLTGPRETFLRLYRDVVETYKKMRARTYGTSPIAESRLEKIDGRLDTQGLWTVFDRAAKTLTPEAQIVFIGSFLYMDADDPYSMSDVDYAVCNVPKMTLEEQDEWLRRFYEIVNRNFGKLSYIVEENAASKVKTPYVATLHLPVCAKKAYHLHRPLFYRSMEGMLAADYLSQLVAFRWVADKANTTKIDELFVRDFPDKAIKRVLSSLYHCALTRDEMTSYAKIRQMYLDYVPLENILEYIRRMRVMETLSRYYGALEARLGISAEVDAIFFSPQPGTAANAFIEKNMVKVTPDIISDFPEVALRRKTFAVEILRQDIATAFLDAQNIRNGLIDNTITQHLPQLEPVAPIVFYYPTVYCPVGCPNCFADSRKKPAMPVGQEPEGVISDENLNKSVDFLRQAKTRVLVISGLGEPLDEMRKTLNLIKAVAQLPDIRKIEVITSGFHFNTPQNAESIFAQFADALGPNKGRVKFLLRFSVDDTHMHRISLSWYAHILEIAKKYEDVIEIRFSTLNDHTAVDQLAGMLGARLEAADEGKTAYDFKNMVLPDGRKISVLYKDTAYMGRAVHGLKIIPELRLKAFADHARLMSFVSVAGDGGKGAPRAVLDSKLMRANIDTGGASLEMYPDGHVKIGTSFPDSIASVQETAEESFRYFSADIVNHAFTEFGFQYIKELLEEIEPAIVRDMELSRLFGFLGTSFFTPQIRLYLAVRILQEYIARGSVSIEDIPSQYRYLVEANRIELVYGYQSTKEKIFDRLYNGRYQVPSQKVYEDSTYCIYGADEDALQYEKTNSSLVEREDKLLELVADQTAKFIALRNGVAYRDVLPKLQKEIFPSIILLRKQWYGAFINDLIRALRYFEQEGICPSSNDLPVILLLSEDIREGSFLGQVKDAFIRSDLKDKERWSEILSHVLVSGAVDFTRHIALSGSKDLHVIRAQRFFEKIGIKTEARSVEQTTFTQTKIEEKIPGAEPGRESLIGKLVDQDGKIITSFDVVRRDAAILIQHKGRALAEVPLAADATINKKLLLERLIGAFELEKNNLPFHFENIVTRFIERINSVDAIVALEHHKDIKGAFYEDGGKYTLYLNKDLINNVLGIIHEMGEGTTDVPAGYRNLTRHTIWRGVGKDARNAFDVIGAEQASAAEDASSFIKMLEKVMKKEDFAMSKNRSRDSPITESEKDLICWNFENKLKGKEALFGAQDFLSVENNARFTRQIRNLNNDLRQGVLNIFLMRSTVDTKSVGTAIGKEVGRKLEKKFSINTHILYFEDRGSLNEQLVNAVNNYATTSENKDKLPKIFVDCLTEDDWNTVKVFKDSKRQELPNIDSIIAVGKDFIEGESPRELPDEVKIVLIGSAIMNDKRLKDDFKMSSEDLLESRRRIIDFLMSNKIIDEITIANDQIDMFFDDLWKGIKRLLITRIDWKEFQDWKNNQDEVLRAL